MSCSRIVNDKKIVLQDGAAKSKMCFNNPSQYSVEVIIVDGCLIQTGKRCDFMLIDHNSIEHLVELKGTRVKDGCEQLEETIIKICNHRKPKYSFLVSKSCPMISTDIQNWKVKFKTRYNSKLQIKSGFCEHLIA